MRRYDGSSRFDSAQGQLRKRFSGGYMFETSYTWSNFKEKVTRLNDTDPDFEERLQETHLPHRLVVNGIWELPFGKGRKWGAAANPIVNAPDRQLERLGDVELAVRPAEPVDGQRLLRRRHHAAEDEVHATIPTCRCSTRAGSTSTTPRSRPTAWTIRPSSAPISGSSWSDNVRTIPSRWDGLRGPRYTNWDMSFVKGLEFGRVRAQIHIELYNAFNDVFYNNPNLDAEQSQVREGDEPEQSAEELFRSA